MLEQEFRISALIVLQISEELTTDQQFELDQWIQNSEMNRIRYQEYINQHKINLKLEKYDKIDSDAIYKLTIDKIVALKIQREKASTRKLWLRVATVAAVLLFASTFAVLFNLWHNPSAENMESYLKNDIPAGGNKAYITFANGKTIQLNSAKTGIVINGKSLVYSDRTTVDSGSLLSEATGDLTITTPRGGQYQITLSDGTKVYMNAGSSLKYPTAFNSTTRKVTLQGEAYFEVAKDKRHPFIVATARQMVTVLGTHFNINAYDDEALTKTTLLEGSVRVSLLSNLQNKLSTLNSQFLIPGQQSTLQGDDLRVSAADTDEAMAWKNGDFIFKDEALESIMRKVSRWYNVDVVFAEEATKSIKLGGLVSRSKNISAVLKMIALTKRVNFKVEERKIIVLNVNN